jgi:hypothetical protein
LDLKLRSFFHAYNSLSFMQLGVEEHGFTRYLPYTGQISASSNPSFPTKCQIDLPASLECMSAYNASRCGNASAKHYPPYDLRCRSWFYDGKAVENAVNRVFFQSPRVSSTNTFVQTAYTPIHQRGRFYGVLISNVLVERLVNEINSMKILNSGYCYLIEAATAKLVSHPQLTLTNCVSLSIQCAEEFSDAEYAAFSQSVLFPLQNTGILSGFSEIYVKKGKQWRLSAQEITYGTIDYVIIATVPEYEFCKTSIEISNEIDKTVNLMIVIFAACVAGLLIVLVSYSHLMTISIVNPFEDLRKVLNLIRNEDLGFEMPTKASSSDMKVLLEAFAKVRVEQFQLFFALFLKRNKVSIFHSIALYIYIHSYISFFSRQYLQFLSPLCHYLSLSLSISHTLSLPLSLSPSLLSLSVSLLSPLSL